MLHAVIMAGGSGTRFWPESRRSRPKQLLKLAGERSMIRQTVDRLHPIVAPERIVVVTAAALAEAIAAELPDVPQENIVAEPCARDTAPCIGLAATRILGRDPEGVMLVLPADHLIRPAEAFHQAVHRGVRLLQSQPDALVTMGIMPRYPATVFGYIQRGAAAGADGEPALYSVEAFHEKPESARAEQFIQVGRHYWNCGIFLWRAARIMAALEQFEPDMHQRLERIAAAEGTAGADAVFAREFGLMHRISIDHAVMEKVSGVYVVEAPFEWEDVGNWEALSQVHGRDEAGNTCWGEHVGLETSDCIIRGRPETLIATAGVSHLIIVQTPDALLVADRRDEESFRRLHRMLVERGYERFL